jgi:hypothetical protein
MPSWHTHAPAAHPPRCPPKRMLPLLGGTMPLSMLIMVVLPAPLGPISAWMWPRVQLNDTSCAGLMPP